MSPLVAVSDWFAGTSAFFAGLSLVIGLGIAILALGILILTMSSGISNRTLGGITAGMLITSGVLFLLVMLVVSQELIDG